MDRSAGLLPSSDDQKEIQTPQVLAFRDNHLPNGTTRVARAATSMMNAQ